MRLLCIPSAPKKAFPHRPEVRLLDFFQDESEMLLVTELMEGGDLCDRILTAEKPCARGPAERAVAT